MWLAQSNEPVECQQIPNIGQTSTFKDPRDNTTYPIARLKDGKCWMTQNLTISGRTISSGNSAMESGTFAIPSATSYTTNLGYNKDLNAVYNHDGTGQGLYYTPKVATTGGFINNNHGPIDDTPDSICPKGWSLPSANEYSVLYSYYPSTTLLKDQPIPNFSSSGFVYGGNISNKGGVYVLTSTFKDSGLRAFNGSNWWNVTSGYGFRVRCIANEYEDMYSTIEIKIDQGIGGLAMTNIYGGDDGMITINQGDSKTFNFKRGTQLNIFAGSLPNYSKMYLEVNNNKRNISAQTVYQVEDDATLTFSAEHEELPYIQDISLDQCTENGLSVIDKRDNKSYTIAKLADGRCWMTQNLRLGGNEQMILTPEDSDIVNNFTLQQSSNELKNYYQNANYVHVEPYSGYYTYYAATAGEGTYAFSGTDTSHSICPKNWRLPTKQDNQLLVNSYNNDSNELLNSVANYHLLGAFQDPYGNGSQLYKQSINGYYWSSTNKGGFIAYHMQISKTSISPESSYTGDNKGAGFAIRCVLR